MINRGVLMIGSNDEAIGAKIDIRNYYRFLTGLNGGVWEENEIIDPLYNPSYYDLFSMIERLKNCNLDYLIVFFSGHGKTIRDLQICFNDKGDYIEESALKGIAQRQLTIFDCCRAVEHFREDSVLTKSFSASSSLNNNVREFIKQKYNERIIHAFPQQATLYSCKRGQMSNGSSTEGAIYFKNLLKSARNVNGEFKTIGETHLEAVVPTINESRLEGYLQEPEAIMPKCAPDKQLIMTINSAYYLR